jgi:alkyl hydroperoxide reductase subunit F
MDRFEKQVEKYNVQRTFAQIKTVSKERDAFVARTETDEEYRSKTIIIATGKRSRTLDAKGVETFVGRGVSYCATCDAPLFMDMNVAVLGGGNSAITAAYELANIARKVYLINRSPWTADEVCLEKIRDAANVEPLVGYQLTEVKGDTTVNAAVFRNLTDNSLISLPVTGIFIEIGLIPNSDVVRDLVTLNQNGEIIVSHNCATSVPGIFAAGDVTTVPEKQIIVAAGEGAKAAISAYKYLLKEGQHAAVGY